MYIYFVAFFCSERFLTLVTLVMDGCYENIVAADK